MYYKRRRPRLRSKCIPIFVVVLNDEGNMFLNNFYISSYKQQHQTFVQHVNQQIVMLDSQKQALEPIPISNTNKIPPLMPAGSPSPNNFPVNTDRVEPPRKSIKPPPPLMSQNITMQSFDNNDNSFGISHVRFRKLILITCLL